MIIILLVLSLLISVEGWIGLGQQSNRYISLSSSSLRMMLTPKYINMPALSSTMTEGKIVSWSKKIGDKVSAGDVLLVVESDKADMDVEAFEDGYLAAIYTPEGESAAVGAAVAAIVDSKDAINSVSDPNTPVATPSITTTVKTVNATPTTVTVNKVGEAVNMPALSSTMKEGKIVSWNKKVGDKVSSGDVILVVESDKADMDVESYEDGFLAAIITGDGEIAHVGSPVAFIAKSKEEIPAVQAFAASVKASGGESLSTTTIPAAASVTAAPVFGASSPAATPKILVNSGRVVASGYAKALARSQGIDLKTIAASRSDGYITAKDLIGAPPTDAVPEYLPAPGVINASPMARKFAAENGLDVTKIKGSGNFGRVTGDDVLIAAGKKSPVTPKTTPAPASVAATPVKAISKDGKATPAPVLDGIIPMDGMKKAVAKNMEKTLSVPIFRVSREIFTDNFDALYAQLKPKGVTVSAMLAKAVTEVLKKHQIINAASVEGGIKYNKDINIAMAVAIDGGLITPTIIKAQDQDLFQISKTWKESVEKAKTKKLSPAEYSSGTFCISNLGMFGVQQFDAILPYGTGSILAIAASTPKVFQLKNGYFGVQKSMTVTITCDHRHIYGADAAEFLKDLAGLYILIHTQFILYDAIFL